ncbi:MAG: EamA family transporter RarD [Planctomycetes bacterium]|nr:EamA family transporter RarD [Planctomycetota bacterium]
MQNATREGFLPGLAAYLWWGLVPIYFHWLGRVGPLDILAHRICWSAVFLAIVLTITKRWPEMIRSLLNPKIVGPLAISALLVAYNWLMYILGVYYQMIVQASLGYFILPLVSIVLALLIFGERMRPLQQLAIAFAFAGVCGLTWTAGEFPWLAIALAVSFAAYGLIRKQVPVDGLVGLTVETIVLLPIALGYLVFAYVERGELDDVELTFKLSLSGIVTAIPLLCFGQAARRLPFSMLGFMQYIAPSVQFLLAIWLFGESVRGGWFNYALVWTALLIFSIDSYLRYGRAKEAGNPQHAD